MLIGGNTFGIYGGFTVIRPVLLLLLCAIKAPIGGEGVEIEEDLILLIPECVWLTNGLLRSKKPGGPNEPGGT